MARKKKETGSIESTANVVEEKAPELTQAELQAKVEAERKMRVEACTQEINAALQKHQCDLDAAILLRAGAVMPSVKVVPVELLRQNRPA